MFGIVLLCAAAPLQARDAFVFLSGGASPEWNAYSQYLQAKAMSGYLRGRYPRDSVWVFFGAGNREGEKPVIADVYRQIKQTDGHIQETWLPGALPDNRPARREVFLRALQQEILPAVRDGGTLYLFVGDHGQLSSGKKAESQIVMWQLQRDPGSVFGWQQNAEALLGVAALREMLAKNLGNGRVVFVMTQCHSGGFHSLAVPAMQQPNKRWFTRTPGWVRPPKQPEVLVNAAGFTATTAELPAAGCVPDPDPDLWAGYERFIPEQLLGQDLFGRGGKMKPAASFFDAHVAATLVDHTIDQPYSTSEQYLQRWSVLIEKFLYKEKRLTPQARAAVEQYRRVLDGAPLESTDKQLSARAGLFKRFGQRLLEQNPALEGLLQASAAELEDQYLDLMESGELDEWVADSPEARKAWNKQIAPAWRKAVRGDAAPVAPALQGFERHVTDNERNHDYLGEYLTPFVFWHSGYADPARFDDARAAQVGDWSRTRVSTIVGWAKASANKSLRTAALTFETAAPEEWLDPQRLRPSDPEPAPLAGVAAARVLFYRRVLGAWQFLLALDEKPALARVAELTALERTPLPAVSVR